MLDGVGIGFGDLPGGAVHDQSAVVEPEAAITNGIDFAERVTDEDDDPALRRDLLHAPGRLVREEGIADRQGLIDDEDVRLNEGAHGEGKASLHAGRVGPDGPIDELAELGEGNHLLDMGVDIRMRGSVDRRVQVDILAAGHIVAQDRADRQHGVDLAADLDGAGGRIGDAR